MQNSILAPTNQILFQGVVNNKGQKINNTSQKYFKGQERQQAGKNAKRVVMKMIEDYKVKLEDSNSKK